MELIIQIISAVYNFLWGDLFTIPLPGGNISAGVAAYPNGDLFHHPHPGHASAALSGDAPCDG